MSCLRYFHVLPKIDEEKEKKQLFDALQESVTRARQVVKDLAFDRDLCDGTLKRETEKWRRTKDPALYEELKQIMTEKKQIMQSLAEAQQRLGEHSRVYRQTRVNLANVDDAKKVTKINKQLKKLDINIDRLADDTKTMGDLLSDHQRAADGTRPYSGGLAISSMGDDEFQVMLAEECRQLELESVQTILKGAPPVPSGSGRRNAVVEEMFAGSCSGPSVGGGGGGAGEAPTTTVQQDIRSFLIQCNEDDDDDDDDDNSNNNSQGRNTGKVHTSTGYVKV